MTDLETTNKEGVTPSENPSGLTAREKTRRVLGTNDLSPTEEVILKWQHNFYGGFFKLLLDAIAHADEENQNRLALGFPEEVRAIRLFRTTWIAENLRERGLL